MILCGRGLRRRVTANVYSIWLASNSSVMSMLLLFCSWVCYVQPLWHCPHRNQFPKFYTQASRAMYSIYIQVSIYSKDYPRVDLRDHYEFVVCAMVNGGCVREACSREICRNWFIVITGVTASYWCQISWNMLLKSLHIFYFANIIVCGCCHPKSDKLFLIIYIVRDWFYTVGNR